MPGLNRQRFDREYAKLMTNHPWGWALYKPVDATTLKPGSCGYFDSDGYWRPIVQLTEKFTERPTAQATNNGAGKLTANWKPVEAPLVVEPGKGSSLWGPKVSKRVETINLDLQTGVEVPNVPAKVSVKSRFVSQADSGAVLVTSGDVKSYHLNEGGDDIALMWMSENSEEILRVKKRILKKHGIWIVTHTHTSTNCGVAFMQSKSAAVEIGLTASAENTLTMSPTGSWTLATEGSETEIYPDLERVVFMSGIYFTKSRMPWSKKIYHTDRQEKQDILRGGANDLPRVIEKGPSGEDVNFAWTIFPPKATVDKDNIAEGQFPLYETPVGEEDDSTDSEGATNNESAAGSTKNGKKAKAAPEQKQKPKTIPTKSTISKPKAASKAKGASDPLQPRSTRKSTQQATLKSLEQQQSAKKRKQVPDAKADGQKKPKSKKRKA